MTASRVVLSVMASLVVLLLVAAGAQAHQTFYTPDDKVRIVYGHFDEPVYTFQKTGLDLQFFNNATGAPITGLESFDHGRAVPPRIFVSYRYGAEGGQELNVSTNFRPQFGQAGKYTTPILFTQPGLYYVKVKGPINGTHYDLVVPPAHEIESSEVIMWPAKVDTNDELAAKIAALEAQVAQLEGDGGAQGASPAWDAGLLIAAILGLVLVLRRR